MTLKLANGAVIPHATPLPGAAHALTHSGLPEAAPAAPPPRTLAPPQQGGGMGHLMGALGGGALGYMLGPDEDKAQSALLGAGAGLGVAHMAHSGAQAARQGFGALHDAAASRGLVGRRSVAAPATPNQPGWHPHANIPTPGSPEFEQHLDQSMRFQGHTDMNHPAYQAKKNELRGDLSEHYMKQTNEANKPAALPPGSSEAGNQLEKHVPGAEPGVDPKGKGGAKDLEGATKVPERTPADLVPPIIPNLPDTGHTIFPGAPKKLEAPPAAPPVPPKDLASATAPKGNKTPLGRPGREIPSNIQAPAAKPNSLEHQMNSEATYAAKGAPTPLQGSLAASAMGQPEPHLEHEAPDEPMTFQEAAAMRRAQAPKFAAEGSMTFGPNGPSFSSSMKDERMEGMHRWVPRQTIERVYHDVDQGLDDQAIIDAEGDRGSVMNPLVGGGLGASLAALAFPHAPAIPMALGGALGAAGGVAMHSMNRPARESDASEALHGIHNENDRLKARHQTASASTPLTMSGGVIDE